MADIEQLQWVPFSEGVASCIDRLLSMRSVGHNLPSVGIAGGSQAGKTFFAAVLNRELMSVNIRAINLSMDDYFLTKDEILLANPKLDINFDNPDTVRLSELAEHIRLLRRGEAVPFAITEYSRTIDGFATAKQVQHDSIRAEDGEVIVVEGLFVHRQPVVAEIDLSVLICQPDADRRMKSRIERDVQKRFYSEAVAVERWQRLIEPSYAKFIDPVNVGERCRVDLFVENPY